MNRWTSTALAALSLVLAACGGQLDEGTISSQGEQALGAACELTRAGVPAEGWICGEARTVECASANGTDPGTIHVVEEDYSTMVCSAGTLEVSDVGPFAVGEHIVDVDVVDAAGNSSHVCTSTLTVVDTTPPDVQTTELNLWPPNHKWHYISPADCVAATDACDDDLDAVFLWASSDEPAEGRGDGNHEPDIRNLSCEGVELRAERSGNNNGRVYELGVRVFDDEGNHTDATCVVTVVHDQSGAVAIDDGDDHRIDLDEAECGPSTGGNNPGGNNPGTGTNPGSGSESGNNGGTEGGGGPELPPGGF